MKHMKFIYLKRPFKLCTQLKQSRKESLKNLGLIVIRTHSNNEKNPPTLTHVSIATISYKIDDFAFQFNAFSMLKCVLSERLLVRSEHIII